MTPARKPKRGIARERQPGELPRCISCGGVRRPGDDRTEEERADPRCWLCRAGLVRLAATNGRP